MIRLSVEFHSPLQFAPADLHDPGFYGRRQTQIESRLALLADPAESFAIMARHHDEKAGIANPFVSWHADLLAMVRIAIDRLPGTGLGAVLRRFAQDIKRRSRGFPDLFLWTATEYRFVEVKSENDQLSTAQFQWLRFLDEGRHRRVAGPRPQVGSAERLPPIQWSLSEPRLSAAPPAPHASCAG